MVVLADLGINTINEIHELCATERFAYALFRNIDIWVNVCGILFPSNPNALTANNLLQTSLVHEMH